MSSPSVRSGTSASGMWRVVIFCLAMMPVGCAPRGKVDQARRGETSGSTEVPVEREAHCVRGPEERSQWPVLMPAGALAVTFNSEFEPDAQSGEHEKSSRCMCSEFLHQLGERPLWPAASGTEVYRFTWVHSFPKPVSVRVERFGDIHRLQVSWERREADIHASGPTLHRTRFLLPSEWSEVLRRLDDFGFWKYRTRKTRGEVIDLDASIWLLEGVRQGRYRAYQVWSPNDEGEGRAFRDVCLYLLDLSGLSVPPDEIGRSRVPTDSPDVGAVNWTVPRANGRLSSR